MSLRKGCSFRFKNGHNHESTSQVLIQNLDLCESSCVETTYPQSKKVFTYQWDKWMRGMPEAPAQRDRRLPEDRQMSNEVSDLQTQRLKQTNSCHSLWCDEYWACHLLRLPHSSDRGPKPFHHFRKKRQALVSYDKISFLMALCVWFSLKDCHGSHHESLQNLSWQTYEIDVAKISSYHILPKTIHNSLPQCIVHAGYLPNYNIFNNINKNLSPLL